MRKIIAASESDLLHRILVDGVVDHAICMLSPGGQVLSWNVGAERVNGYRAKDIVGRNFDCFYTSEDRRAGLPSQALAIARTSGRFEGDGWRVRRNGERYWAHVTVSPIVDADGNLVGFAKIIRDLTASEQQADRAREATRNLSLALANMSQGLSLFDASERLVFCSARWYAMMGFDEAAFPTGLTFSDMLRLFFRSVDPTLTDDDTAERVALRRNTLFARLAAEGAATSECVANDRTLLMNHRAIPGGGWVTTIDDVTERRMVERHVVHLAHHDVLTDLPNRTILQQAIEDALAEQAGAILCIDLDHFKPVNDTFGHHAGDWVLRTVADRIRAQLGPRDVAIRLGGDEFVVVARDGADAVGATCRAERLIDTIRQPIGVDGGFATLGASVGIALVPTDGRDADILLRHADIAMYRAKESGNTCVLYEGGMEELILERRHLERNLRDALLTDGFDLHYQPIVRLDANRIVGFEALLRWTDPRKGPMAPDAFIPFAEEIGLMPEIDDWVLRAACREAKSWPGDLVVSVNVSSTRFRRPGLASKIVAILAETGLPAHRLEIEITETATIDNLAAARTVLDDIRCLGVQIALDDFGTGYSSLSLLHNLPFHRIKIDRSFVDDLVSNPQSAAIVRAVCGLCRGLGVRATAEGVETAEQVEYLAEEGCSDLQGYLISRPMPASEVGRWIQAFDNRHVLLDRTARVAPKLDPLASAAARQSRTGHKRS